MITGHGPGYSISYPTLVFQAGSGTRTAPQGIRHGTHRHMNSSGDDPHLRRLRTITRVMDEAVRIPGTRFRVGLDGLTGLLPGLGDALTAAISAYGVIAAARTGVPASVLARVVGNVALDLAVGAVPLLGDLFDLGFKANRRNLRLLESYAAAPGPTRAASRRLLVVALAAVVLIIAGAVAFAVWAGNVLARALG